MSPGEPGQPLVLLERFQQQHRTGILTLLFTDLVDSTRLKQELGDKRAVALIQQHHAQVREWLKTFPDAQEIETAGDSFLLVFARPSDGVRFALGLHTRNRQLSGEAKAKIEDRVGIHAGEVFVHDQAGDAKLFGSQMDLCGRVVSLAQGGQVLLTRFVFDNARAVLKGEDLPGVGPLSWVSHGPYLLKGIEEAVEVCEVGEAGQSPPSAPKTTEKAQRQVPPDEEPVLGWRPAVGQEVPNTPWILEEKLGEGGFGEVWVAQHPKLKERHVFKFCFRADRVRALKRELTLFRLLKEHVGEHPNIVRLYDVYLEQPPFYLEEEFVDGKDLKTWCEAQGGIDKVPMEVRLEIVAQAAEALQAAHDAGIIHRDVKPGNILVSGDPTGTKPLTVKLTDFGIGQVISAEFLKGVTQAGFTQTMLGSTGSGTGTTMYLAPEIVAGIPATTRSDIYSLGVVLYQLLVGDFKQPLATDWAMDVNDPLLQEDVRRCVTGKPEERFSSAAQLAEHLRGLPQRQAEETERESLHRQAAQRQKVVMVAAGAAVLLLLLAIALGYGMRQAQAAKVSESRLREMAQAQAYASDMKAAQVALEQNNLGLTLNILRRHEPMAGQMDLRGMEWRYLWQAAQGDEVHSWLHPHMVVGARFSPDVRWVASACFDGFLRVWDAGTRRPEPVATIERGVQDDDAFGSIRFSPDGRLLASAHRDGIILVDATNWRIRRLLEVAPEEKALLNARIWLAYSVDGRWLAACFGLGVRLWDTTTWKSAVLRPPTPESSWNEIGFVPNTGALAICDGKSNRVQLRDPSTHRLIGELVGLANPHRLAISSSGELLAATDWTRELALWDLKSGQLKWKTSAHRSRIYGLAFAKTGRLLATGGFDQLIHLWDTSTGVKVRTLRGHLNEVWSVEFSSDDRFLVSSGKDATVRVWETAPQRPPTRWWLNTEDTPIGFGPGSRCLVTLTTNRTTFRHWEDGKPIRVVPLQTPWPTGAATRVYSSATMNLFVGYTNGAVRMYNSETGALVRSLNLASESFMFRDTLPLEEDWLVGEPASGGGTHGLVVWNTLSGRVTAQFPEFAWPYNKVAISPDGRRLAIGAPNHLIEIWSLPERRLVHTLRGHQWHVLALGFSPDSRFLATGSWDGDARVWDMVTGEQSAPTLRGHGSGVHGVCFSADGRTLVTAGDDNTVRLWHLATGREMLLLDNARRASLDFLSPDGALLVVWDVTREAVRVSRIPTLAEIDAAEKAQAAASAK